GDFTPIASKQQTRTNPPSPNRSSASTTASANLPSATIAPPKSALAALTNPAPSATTAWSLPKIESILDPASPVHIRAGVDQERARVIEQTLLSFGVPSRVVEIQRGPTVTQFGVEPEFIETRQGRTRV